jgi:hypothetical protein
VKSAEKRATWASTARWFPRTSTSLVIPAMVFILIKALMLGGKTSFPFDNHQQGGMGQNFSRNEPCLRDTIRDQVRINDEVGKKIHATNKLLENINAKMDNFTIAMQNQLSFNKMLKTQIQQISVAIPSQSIVDSSKTPFLRV